MKNLGLHGFQGELYQTFKEEKILVLHKLSQKTKEEDNFLFQPMRPVLQKQTKTLQKRKQKQNYIPISLMNSDAVILQNMFSQSNLPYDRDTNPSFFGFLFLN